MYLELALAVWIRRAFLFAYAIGKHFMDFQTVIDNVLFFAITLPAIWLVWESKKPAHFDAGFELIKRNWLPILKLKTNKKKQ